MTTATRVATNADRLVTQVLTGEVWPALGDRHAYRVDADRDPFLLPGMGAVTLGVHLGDPATGWATDHLEPGLSVRHRDVAANYALQFLTCVGNRVTVASGPAKGGTGVVIGQHAYVLVDAADAVLEEVTVGDHLTVRAFGQGLRLLDHPDIVVKNLDPALIDAWGLRTLADGRLEVPAAVEVPAEAVGAGSGMHSEYANTDLMGAYAGLSDDLSLGLEPLRIGDVVTLADTDHRFGRGYRPGWLTVGVISTGQCALFGHGPGPSSLLSGPASAFAVVPSAEANLGRIVAATPGGSMSGLRLAAMNLAGVVEHPEAAGSPYAVSIDGRPYLPTGDAGVVLGVTLGDRLDATDTDHVAPGLTLAHPDPAARHSLTALSCVGNEVVVRSGAAAGERGFVIGKRGEAGRVIVDLSQEVLATVRPGDAFSVRAYGQGATLATSEVAVLNLDPALLPHLPVTVGEGVDVGVRCVLPSRVCGNGIGRPAHAWDVDLALPDDAETLALLHFGDLVAVTDLDARANLGYRRGMVTVGVIVHGPSPLPGHGPGFLPVLSGPSTRLRVGVEDDHVGVTVGRLHAARDARGGEG